MKASNLLFFMCFVACSSVYGESDPSDLYQPAKQANIRVPWKVGEVVDRGYAGWNQDVYRKYLGVNSRGEFLIQAYYAATNKPYTSVLRLTQQDDVTKPMTDFCASSMEGLYVMYGPRLDEKLMEGHCHAGKQVGVWRMWDRTTGELKLTEDFDSPSQ